MSSSNYLNKVVTIDGKDYLLLSHESDLSKVIRAQDNVIVPNENTSPSAVTGVYVAKANIDAYEGVDSEDGQLETLVTKSSSIIMYDQWNNEFVEVSAEKMNLLNKLDVFSPNTFTLTIPGGGVAAPYSFDEGVTWRSWLEVNSSIGLAIYTAPDSADEAITGLTADKHIIRPINNECYILCTASSGGVRYVEADDLIVKNRKYFLVAPGVPADVIYINHSTGPASTTNNTESKIDLAIRVQHGPIKTTHLVVAALKQATTVNKVDDYVYTKWGNSDTVGTPANTWANTSEYVNEDSSVVIQVLELEDTENASVVTTQMTGLTADCVYTFSIFPINYDKDSGVTKVNQNADVSGSANRTYITAKAVRYLPCPTVSQIVYNGSSQLLTNYLSAVASDDGYTFGYISSDYAADSDQASRLISVSNISQTNAGSYESTLTILNSGYYWLDATGAPTDSDEFILTWEIQANSNSPFTVLVPEIGDEYITSFEITVNKHSGVVNRPEISVAALDSNIASVSISGFNTTASGWVYTVSLGAVKADSTIRITVTPTDTDLANFPNSAITHDVKVSGLDTDTFGNNSWAAIQHAVISGVIPDNWMVGSTKTITLAAGKIGDLTIPATTLEVMIVNKTSSCLAFCFVKDSHFVAFIDGSFGSNKYGGVLSNANAVLCMCKQSDGTRVNGLKSSMSWSSNCFMRESLLGSDPNIANRNNTLYNRLPADLRSVLSVVEVKSIKGKSSASINASEVITTYDVLPLMNFSELGVDLNAGWLNRSSIPTDATWKAVTTANAFARFTELRNLGQKIAFYGLLDNQVKDQCQIHVRDFWPYYGAGASTGCTHTTRSEHCAFYVYEPSQTLMMPMQDRSRGVAPFFCIGAPNKYVNGVGICTNYR